MNEDKLEILELCRTWFVGIMDKCDKLTTGNVSHQKATIRAMAKECISYIDLYLKKVDYEERKCKNSL